MTRSRSTRVDLHETQSLSSLVRAWSSFGDREAILAFHKDGVEAWTYRRLETTVNALAAGLIKVGLRQGERVLLHAPNSPAWIVACFALLRVAAVPVPIDSQMADDDLAHVIKDCEAHRLLTTGALAEHLSTLGLDRQLAVILLDANDDPRSLQRLSGDPTGSFPSTQQDDHALLFYTSGSSGRPKGVPLSHRNLLTNLQALLEAAVYRPDERLLLPLPLHHVYPFMVGLLAPLALGFTIVLPHSLTGPQILRALREGRVTALVAVPRIFSALLNAIERHVQEKGRTVSALFHALLTCSSWLLRRFGLPAGRFLFAPLRRRFGPQLTTMVYGGSPLAPDVAWKLAGLGWLIAGGYGLTETSPILTFMAPGQRRFDSAGRPLAGVQLRITGQGPQADQGEIQARGSNVFAGYLHLPDKTAEAFTEDGWFRTGDLGYFDREGWLYLVGRASSRITLPGGEKIWPERLEELLDGAASISESGVLIHQGRLVAIIVPRRTAIQPDDLDPLRQAIRTDIDACLSPLPSYARLTEFVVSFDPLSRTRLGKIQRHRLRERFEEEYTAGGSGNLRPQPLTIDQMAPEDRQLLEDPIAARTWTWVTGRFPGKRLTPDTNMQLELGLDSLEWMTLTLELRDQIGIDLPEERVARIATVRDLLREAAEAMEVTGAGIEPAERLKTPDSLLDQTQRRWLRPRGRAMRRLGQALHLIDGLLMRHVFHLEVQGLEHLPAEGPCVLIPNHVSLLDPLALFAALPPDRLSRTGWGGWTGFMFRSPLMRLVSRATRVLPVDQSSRPLANLALAAAALQRGETLVWFPEGGLSRDGLLHPFQPGIGLILTAHPVPAIPVFIEGSFEALPPDSRRLRPGPLKIQFGTALDPNELGGRRQGAERYRTIAMALHDRVAALGGASEGTRPSFHRADRSPGDFSR